MLTGGISGFSRKNLVFSKRGFKVYKNIIYKKQTDICGTTTKLSTIIIFFLANINVRFPWNTFELFIRMFFIRNVLNAFYKNFFYKKQIIFSTLLEIGSSNLSNFLHEAGGLLVLKGGTSGFSQKNHVFVKNAFFYKKQLNF